MANGSSGDTSSVLFETLNGKDITLISMLVNCALSIVGFLALSLNGVVLDTLVRRTTLDVADLLMCHLAVTDMLTGVSIVYTVIYNIVNFQSTIECLVRLGSVLTFVLNSVFHLALLTVDRFVKIVFPYGYQDFITRRSMSIASAIVWTVSVIAGLLPAFGWRDIPGPSELPCSFLGVLANSFLQVMLGMFIVPVVIIAVLYSKIFLVARRHARAIAATNVVGKADSNTMKFTKTVVILIGAYLLCFCPLGFVILMYTSGGFIGMSAYDAGDYVVYASILSFANSIVNPIIYAFKLPPVRRRFLGFIGRPETGP